MFPTQRAGTTMTIHSRGFAKSVEAARFLGITRQHLSKLVREGKVPAQKFGRSLRVPWRWLVEQETCGK
jgi:excisionase family DNA binding protein